MGMLQGATESGTGRQCGYCGGWVKGGWGHSCAPANVTSRYAALLVGMEAELAVARMRLTAVERQRDSARRVARALYKVLLSHDNGLKDCCGWALEARRVLAEEARREKEIEVAYGPALPR